MAVRITANHVRAAAAPIIRRNSYFPSDFISLFGVNPEVIAAVWNMCTFPYGTQLKHLLWACLFLKVYATTGVLVSLAGGDVCGDTLKTRIWQVLDVLSEAASSVVSCLVAAAAAVH